MTEDHRLDPWSSQARAGLTMDADRFDVPPPPQPRPSCDFCSVCLYLGCRCNPHGHLGHDCATTVRAYGFGGFNAEVQCWTHRWSQKLRPGEDEMVARAKHRAEVGA